MASTRCSPVILCHLAMPETRAGCPDGIPQTFLLNPCMKQIDHHLTVVMVYLTYDIHGILCEIQKACFKTVQRFQTDNHIFFCSVFGQFLKLRNKQSSLLFFLFLCCFPEAAHLRVEGPYIFLRTHLISEIDRIPDISHRLLPYLLIRTSQIAPFAHRRTGGHMKIVLSPRRLYTAGIKS